jgi:hypothetical protein
MGQIYGPRPQGAPGQPSTTATSGGQQLGAGIAGVASKLEADSIKVYNEREKYNEWEFVYDFSKDKKRGGGIGQAGQPGQAQQQQQQSGNQPNLSAPPQQAVPGKL